jgi:hypothetical protein
VGHQVPPVERFGGHGAVDAELVASHRRRPWSST